MIKLSANSNLPSSIQFDSVSIGDAVTASSGNFSSTVTCSLLVVTNIASINRLIVTSAAQFSAASFAGAVIMLGSLNVTGGIQASQASFNRLDISSNIQALRGSFSTLDVGSGVFAVSGSPGVSTQLELGQYAGNHAVLIDLRGDNTYTDYGVRLSRAADGADSDFSFINRGIGQVKFECPEAGQFVFITSNLIRWYIRSDGDLEVSASTALIDLTAIGAGRPNFSITATTDTPSTVFATSGTFINQTPDGYLEMVKGGSAVYVPFFR